MNFNLFKWLAVSLAAVACAGIIAVGPARAETPPAPDLCPLIATGGGIAQDMRQQGLTEDQMADWFGTQLEAAIATGQLTEEQADAVIFGVVFVLENVPFNLDPEYVAGALYKDCVRGNA